MVRNVMDNANSSAQPNSPLTGGGYYNTSSFQAAPNIEGILAYVLDNRTPGSAAIVAGKLMVEAFTAANAGDALYNLSATANAPIPMFSYGVFQGGVGPGTVPYTAQSFVAGASTGGNQMRIVQKGAATALCTTGAVGISPGTPLVADGAGNLTAATGSATAPTIGTITTFGTSGAATVSYIAYDRNSFGLDSAASTQVSVTTANATLSPTNGNIVPITIPAGSSSVVVVRSVGGATQGVVGIVAVPPGATSVTFVDQGQAAGGAYAAPTSGTFANGVVLAISKGTLAASTATPTAVLVNVGGY